MPKQYEAIRDTYLKKGVSEKTAKAKAARIYIASGKGGSRSTRAKQLAKDR